MVRHTYSQGMLHGDSRRSLRSDRTSCDSNSQMTASANNWKSLLTSKRTSLPSFSNGHHLRSKSVDNSPRLHEDTEIDEAQCNGITSTHHCYGTRYGTKTSEHNLKVSSSRKSNQWDGCFEGKSPRNQTSSVNSSESGRLSPLVNNLGHKLRSRHVWFPNNISANTNNLEFDDHVHSRPEHLDSLENNFQEREQGSVLVDVNCEVHNKEQKGYKNPESKNLHNQAMKRKRLTAEEKLIEDNKAYYKLEVKNSKLRSSGYYLTQTDSINCVSQETSEETTESSVCNGEQYETFDVKEVPESGETISEVKRNKIRLSELSLLNNEAENFMFGEPSRSNDDSEEDSSDCTKSCDSDECNLSSHNGDVSLKFKHCEKDSKVSGKNRNLKTYNGSAVNGNRKYYCCAGTYDCNVRSTDNIKCNDSCKLCECCCSEPYSNGVENITKRPKRKSQTEVLANDHDHCDLYKCERVETRDSLQSNEYSHYTLNMPNKLESENDIEWTESEDWMKNNGETVALKCETTVDAHSSCSECEVHKLKTNSKMGNNSERQGINMKLSDKGSDVKAEALTGLHFSFEGIPESEPWYQTYQRQDEGEEYYLSGVNDCMYWKSFLLPYEMPVDKLNPSVNTAPKSTNPGPVKRRKRKANAALLDKKPRKSPRCHASTLAILSSLMHHRKRKESDKVRDDLGKTSGYSNESADSSLPDKINSSESGGDLRDFAQNIDQLLDLCSDVGLQSDNLPVQESDDLNCVKCVKSKSLKCKKSHKCMNSGKKCEADNFYVKDSEGIDVDPVVLEELAGSGENPLNCIDDLSVKNRGGPCMDVISLLNGYVSCCCVDDSKNKDIPSYENGFQSSSIRESYNSSECASSTCETIQYSDVADHVVRVRGKKRKRKKNLTGWPVEKQKLKRRLMLKLSRPVIELNAKGKESDKVCDKDSISSELIKEKSEVESSGQVNDLETNDSINPLRGSVSSEICVEDPSRTSTSEVLDTDSVELLGKTSNIDHVINNCTTVTSSNSTDKLCASRTVSIDSNSQHCDFQPRVRVKKINNVSNLNFVIKTSASVSSINNSRKLRSTSYISSATLRKKQFYECGEKMEVARRASARMKKSCSRWDSWSTRRRR